MAWLARMPVVKAWPDSPRVIEGVGAVLPSSLGLSFEVSSGGVWVCRRGDVQAWGRAAHERGGLCADCLQWALFEA